MLRYVSDGLFALSAVNEPKVNMQFTLLNALKGFFNEIPGPFGSTSGELSEPLTVSANFAAYSSTVVSTAPSSAWAA